MSRLEGACREVFEKTEWVAIATAGGDGPHLVATWGDYIRQLGIDGDTLRIPVGGMHNMQANVQRDPRVQILSATRHVQGAHGPGKGCAILGRASFQTEGPDLEAVKARFPWARAVLMVHIESIQPQL